MTGGCRTPSVTGEPPRLTSPTRRWSVVVRDSTGHVCVTRRMHLLLGGACALTKGSRLLGPCLQPAEQHSPRCRHMCVLSGGMEVLACVKWCLIWTWCMCLTSRQLTSYCGTYHLFWCGAACWSECSSLDKGILLPNMRGPCCPAVLISQAASHCAVDHISASSQ